eukprot:Skav219539  [mRNA]  locus=scaffold556:10452:14270:- [translate_table: standard]
MYPTQSGKPSSEQAPAADKSEPSSLPAPLPGPLQAADETVAASSSPAPSPGPLQVTEEEAAAEKTQQPSSPAPLPGPLVEAAAAAEKIQQPSSPAPAPGPLEEAAAVEMTQQQTSSPAPLPAPLEATGEAAAAEEIRKPSPPGRIPVGLMGRAVCAACGEPITADTKSPVPAACFVCWQQQEKALDDVHEQRCLCEDCKVEITEVNQSRFPNFCRKCYDMNMATLQQQAHARAEMEALRQLACVAESHARQAEDPALVEKAVAPTSKKSCIHGASLCTWWQRKQKELGHSKSQALKLWSQMGDAERQDFKENLLAELGLPSPDGGAVVTPTKKACPDDAALDQATPPKIQKDLSNFRTEREEMAAAATLSAFFQRRDAEAFAMYLDVVSLLQAKQLESVLAAEKEFAAWHVNRKKLSAVKLWAEQKNTLMFDDVPAEFATGRSQKGMLTLQQKQDLLTHVQVMQMSNTRFSKKDVLQSMLKYYLVNCGLANPQEDIDWNMFSAYERSMDVCYRKWLEWVRENHPKEFQVVNRKIIGVKGERAAMLSPQSVRAHFAALTCCLERCGILDAEGNIVHAHRLWCCDEKLAWLLAAFVSSLVASGPLSMQSGFKHISVLPFVSMAGDISKPYITMSGSCVMNAWAKTWPGALFAVSEKGAVTTEIFSQFFAHFCKYIRSDLAIPLTETVVLVLDSGGGSLSHLSTDVGLLSEKYNVAPYYLPPHHTCAAMPLDQAPNRAFERKWSEIRSQSTSFSSLEALDSCHQCFEFAYTAENAVRGFAATGLLKGSPPDVDAIVVKRPELFKQLVPVQDRNYKEPDTAAAVLPQPRGYERATATNPCVNCKKKVSPSAKFCPSCGRDNNHYCEIQACVAQGAKSQGFTRKPAEITDMKDALDFSPTRKKNLTKIWGDIQAKVRKVQSDPGNTALDTVDVSQPPEKKPKSDPQSQAPSSSSTGEKIVEPDKTEGQDEPEIDLECVQDCQKYIVMHWTSPPEGLADVALFYVNKLKDQSTKSFPLSALMHKEIISTGILKKPPGRKTWFQAWQTNRQKRFVKLPQYLKQK